jgi:hypothetical protein
MDYPPEPSRPEISINLSMQSMCGAARFAVLESLLGSLVFSLQQCPRQIHELRSWRTKFEEAEKQQRESGGRKTPRSLTCRRALLFISRYDAMMESAKLAFINRRVLQTVIVLGPSASAPRFVLHINFEEGLIGDPPLQRLRPSIYEEGWKTRNNIENEDNNEEDSGYVSSSTETDIILDRTTDRTTSKRDRSTVSQFSSLLSTVSPSEGVFESHSSSMSDVVEHNNIETADQDFQLPSPTPLIRESYQQPLEGGAHGLISRTAARQLIVEAQTVYGMQPVSLNKIHLLIQTQRLVSQLDSGSSVSSSEPSNNFAVEDDVELAEIAPLFHPKPSFSLRQPRKRIVRMVREEVIVENKESEIKEDNSGDLTRSEIASRRSYRMVRTPMWSAPKYRLVTAKVSGRPLQTVSFPKSDGLLSSIYKPEWHYCFQSPQSFKGSLPNPSPPIKK